MIVIVCLDDKGGMMFNHRRQSRDKILCEQILRLTKHAVLHMSHYSAGLFSDFSHSDLTVSDTFLRDAGNGDFCFVEDAALAPVEQRIEKLINNLHQSYLRAPVVMFFPGTYNEQELILFNEIKDDNYYRAFRLVK